MVLYKDRVSKASAITVSGYLKHLQILVRYTIIVALVFLLPKIK